MTRQTLSDIFDLYEKSLSQTRRRIEERVLTSTAEMKEFHNAFFQKLVVDYRKRFQVEPHRAEIHRELQQRHRASTLKFWAIDGACKQIETSDLVIFYGGAYAVKGSLELQRNPAEVAYHESGPDDDSSLVAYMPLSPEDLNRDDAEARFLIRDSDYVTTSGLDRALMLLAEIYLCYEAANLHDGPHLILWDQSISSVYANATPNTDDLRFTGLQIKDETIWYPELLVGYSKPWNEELGTPSAKAHGLWQRAIAKLYNHPQNEVKLSELVAETGMTADEVRSQTHILWDTDKYGRRGQQADLSTSLVEKTGETLRLRPQYQNAVEKIRRLFETFCKGLFKNKNASLLSYNYIDANGITKPRFLSAEELKFLVALGLRFTFEACWSRGVQFLGIAKDSNSTYFTNHYLGVMRHQRQPGFDFTPRLIPATDRLTTERVPYVQPDLEAPWATAEFDAVFMTLRLKEDPDTGIPDVVGVRGYILMPPNILARSLVQFYLDNKTAMDPSMGHVLFLDRLVHPKRTMPRFDVVKGHSKLGTIKPFVHADNSVANREQEIAIYLLHVVTKNVFPEVIGYPDPLHYADRGAKAVFRMVEPMLRSSEGLNRTNPIHKTLRQNRGG